MITNAKHVMISAQLALTVELQSTPEISVNAQASTMKVNVLMHAQAQWLATMTIMFAVSSLYGSFSIGTPPYASFDDYVYIMDYDDSYTFIY